MDIKLFAGDKEIITPKFLLSKIEDNNKNILQICIKNFNKEEQNKFLKILNLLKNKHFILNENYVSIDFNDKIYYFDIQNYKKYKIEKLLITGSYDLTFVFIDIEEKILNNEFIVFKLKNHPIKQ